jgi:hypothetical protein
MGILCWLLGIGMLVMTSGCYAEMTGTVVDAETGAPIEGAVVLVEWTVTKGVPGMTVTETYEVIEVVSDKEGRVYISGVFNPSVNPPRVTVYKAGYVAWNNDYIFPSYKKRTDFRWQNDFIFKLEKFKSEYSYIDHWGFIIDAIHIGAMEKKKLIRDASKWEEDKASEERKRKDRIN